MFENAASLAEGYYQENQRQVGANTFAIANDLGTRLSRFSIDSPGFTNYYLQQVVVRSLNESAIIEIGRDGVARTATRSEEHTSELQSLMRISYAVFCLKKKKKSKKATNTTTHEEK